MVWNIITNNVLVIGCYLFPILNPYYIYLYKTIQYWYSYLFPRTPIIKESTSSEWINICSLIYSNSDYQLVNTDIISKTNVKTEYYEFYKSFYSNYDYEHDKTIKEHLFIAKLTDNIFICKVCFPKHIKYMFDSSDSNTTKQNESELSLLYIEYSHPKMTTAISLPFNNYMLQPYNELFTPAFVLRQLQTQTEFYYFDMDYTLSILDSNLVTIKLNSKNYILLQPNTYEIIQR